MENFQYYSPTKFVFGKNTENEVGKLIKQFNAKKVLIHYGGGSIIRSGLLSRVENALQKEKIDYLLLGGVQPNPRSGLVYDGIKLVKKEKIDFILAIGGGSAIDSAKAIAAGALYEGDFWDFFDRKARIRSALPIGVVLTIPAAGSEGSTATVITHENGMLKRGTGSDLLRPIFSIINPELTFTLPTYQTGAGISDMMAHIFERYLTPTKNVDLTDRLCEATLKSIIDAARVISVDPFNYEARATICWAGTIAHNGSLGVGREEDWATHGLEHELSALYDVTHGAGLAVLFPAYMEYTIDTDIMRYRQLAIRVFDVEDIPSNPKTVALEGIKRLKAFFKEIGMPLSFDEIGASEADIEILLDKLAINRGFPLGSFKKLTREDARNIFLLACKK
jgi:alcohol dehydrogenase YqhD (iron-dependent ADH family)